MILFTLANIVLFHVISTNKNEQINNEYWYDAFGNFLEAKEQVYNRITYTGQQLDGIIGQYYLRARFYNHVIARFNKRMFIVGMD